MRTVRTALPVKTAAMPLAAKLLAMVFQAARLSSTVQLSLRRAATAVMAATAEMAATAVLVATADAVYPLPLSSTAANCALLVEPAVKAVVTAMATTLWATAAMAVTAVRAFTAISLSMAEV